MSAAPGGPAGTPGGPEVDLSPLLRRNHDARAACLRQLRSACESPGFFFAHSGDDLMTGLDQAYAQGRRFFTLPDDDPAKRAVHAARHDRHRGWWPRGEEPAYVAGTVANLQSFDLGPDDTKDYSHNPWPAVEGFRQPVWQCYLGLEALADALFPAFAEMLGLDRQAFARHRGPQSSSQMRMLHYAAARAGTPANVGISAHTDFECFTLMHQNAGGLELRTREGRWIHVPACKNRLIVIIGDMLERWTNGVLRATGHRVPLLATERYSIVMFCAVDAETQVAPLPEFIGPDTPARYAPVTQGEHIDAQVQRALANRAAVRGASSGE